MAELGEELAANLKAGMDDGENKEGGIGLRDNLGVKMAGNCEDGRTWKREVTERCMGEIERRQDQRSGRKRKDEKGEGGNQENGARERSGKW